MIVVTGGGRGFGRVLAQELISSGARVVITGRNKDVLNIATAELGKKTSYHVFEVSDNDAVSAAFSDIVDKYGEIDTLVNNAGVLGPVDFFLAK